MSERGSVTVAFVAVVAMAAVLVVALAGAAGGALLAHGRAQDLADAAALAAAAAPTAGARAAAQAAVTVDRGAVLVSCRCGGARPAQVVVEVRVPARAARLLGLRTVRARATAALVVAGPT